MTSPVGAEDEPVTRPCIAWRPGLRARLWRAGRWLKRTLLPLLAAGAANAQTAACPPAVPALDAAQAQALARDRGPLWRVSRDGRASYLYGTLHVGRPHWAVPGPRLARALRETDVLALELDPADADAGAALQEAAAQAAEVPAALLARLDALAVRACLPEGALAPLHPMLQAVVLSMLEARWDGLDVAYAQEQLLAAEARRTGRTVHALETARAQTRALIPQDGAELRRALEQTVQQLESGAARRVVARLVTAWERGDLATLADYERWCDCIESDADRLQLRRLNDDRNPALAAGIEALHRDGRRVLAAVGALHMTGRAGLPQLLAERGFAVERLH